MNYGSIRLELVYDDPPDFYIVVSASNGEYSAVVDLDFAGESLAAFAKGLLTFPRSRDDEVTLLVGDRAETHFACRVALLDALGHAVIDLTFRRNAKSPNDAEAHFGIRAEPAALNDFGSQVLRLLDGGPAVLDYSFDGD